MLRLNLALTACLLTAACTTAQQHPPPPPGWGRGAGTATQCEAWMSKRSDELRGAPALSRTGADVAWMQGFLTGMNVERNRAGKQELVSLPDPEVLLILMDSECTNKPTATLYDVGFALFQRIVGK